MSLLLRPDIPPYSASMITLVAGMAVSQAVREMTGLPAQIKWPNDVVVDGRKICGILTEMSTEMESIHYIVTGIGINVNQHDFPEEIMATATSLRIEAARKISRSALIACTMERFEACYDRFLDTEDLSLLKDGYQAMLANLDREVQVLDPAGAYKGICRGIDETGRLLVDTQEGMKAVLSGEVSVRGIYGYV